MKKAPLMLSKTLEIGLAEYRIGPKVRARRKRKRLSLAELSAHTGLSLAMLSKIERGIIIPTLPTLLRIALAFGVGLEHFFVTEGKSAVAVTRSKDRMKLPDRSGNPSPAFLFESLNYPLHDRSFEAYLAEFTASGERSEPHSHAGTELLFVLDGQLSVTINDDEHSLDAGDAICFDAAAEHSYRCEAGRTARVLVAVTP